MKTRKNQTSYFANIFSKARTKQEYEAFFKHQNMNPDLSNDEETLFLVLNVIQFRRWGGDRWEAPVLQQLIKQYGEQTFLTVLKALTMYQAVHFKTKDSGGIADDHLNLPPAYDSLYYDEWPYPNNYIETVKKILADCGNKKIAHNLSDMHFIKVKGDDKPIISKGASGNGLPYFFDYEFLTTLKENSPSIYKEYLGFISLNVKPFIQQALPTFLHNTDLMKFYKRAPDQLLGYELTKEINPTEIENEMLAVSLNKPRAKIHNFYELFKLLHEDMPQLTMSTSSVSTSQTTTININDYLNDGSSGKNTLTPSILSQYLTQMTNNTGYDDLLELGRIYHDLNTKLNDNNNDDYQNDDLPLFGKTRQEKINDHIKILKEKLLEIVTSNLQYDSSLKLALKSDHVKELIDHFRKEKKEFTDTRIKIFELFPQLKEEYLAEQARAIAGKPIQPT